jgi:hypothetical protein
MTRLTLVWVTALPVVMGCAHAPGPRAPEAVTQLQWSGPPPHVAVQLAGAGASGELQAQCDAAVTHSGAVSDGNATVQAIVTLDGGGSRVDLLSQRRGVVRSENRPALAIEHLCAQAAVAAASLLRDEQTGSSMDSQGNSYAITPVSTQQLHSPVAQPSDQPGGQGALGPIQ